MIITFQYLREEKNAETMFPDVDVDAMNETVHVVHVNIASSVNIALNNIYFKKARIY